ncbi:MAG: phosphopentomutase, partial [Solirubrobacterales bacterium]|nr:phosphopentomutase [Solirubrobacterales bacterium]
MPRAAVVVLDACGVGELPDAADYGDAGSNTLVHLASQVGGLELPALESLGLGSIVPISGVAPVVGPAVYGRLRPLGPGKESTTGHWELMGVVPSHALPTYPDGFPDDVVAALERATGYRFCCNRPYSGTEVIKDYGEHHLETGELILYTSADSVLQIAAHVDLVSESSLYAVCSAARSVMTGGHAVGRVIARPFEGPPGAFRRTEGRHDYALHPQDRSYLEELQDAGVPVHGVGKIHDLFAGVGVDVTHAGATNSAGIAETTRLLRELDSGLIFVNLVETDQVYGHRHDVSGFERALVEIDAAVAAWMGLLRDDDLLILTAD